MIDIVTVVFAQEIAILRVQAQSIDLYCRDIGVKNIFVVVNDADNVTDQIDPAWWGSFADRVQVVARSSFDCDFVSNGWVSQQVLKMLAASSSANEWSMVLDAKTIFVNTFPIDKLFDKDHKLKVGLLPIYPVFEPSRQITNQLFGIDLKHQAGPGGVPFFFHTQTLRDMIEYLEQRVNQNFSEWFQSQGMLTEFILYSGWIEYRSGLDRCYSNWSCFNVCNLCHSELDIADTKISEYMHDPRILTVSIHRNAWSQLNNAQQQTYRDFLISRGISREIV
jgi:hypothetical protein